MTFLKIDGRISNQVYTFDSKMGLASHFTFVSITGPTLDKSSAKAMRAHTTKANFARRRRRLVRDHAAQKDNVACVKFVQGEEVGLTTDRGLVVGSRPPLLSHPGVDQQLNRTDALYIQHCT